jgi:hypothetical protein
MAKNYIASVCANNPRFKTTIRSFPHEFACVAAEDLLAVQYHVLLPRSEKYASVVPVGTAPTMNQALALCLPDHVQGYTPNGLKWSGNERNGGVMLTSDDLNLRVLGFDFPEDQAERVRWGPVAIAYGSPLVHVGELQGRHYLLNGYHRVVGLLKRGMASVPCLVLHLNNWDDLGIGAGYFSESILLGADPPTVGHFVHSAYGLEVKKITRTIHISWTTHEINEG